MKLTLTLPDDSIATVDVTEKTTFSSLKLQISLESQIDSSQLIIIKDGNILNAPDENTLKDLDIKDDDLLMVTRAPRTMQNILNGRDATLLQNIDFSSIRVPGLQSTRNQTSAADEARNLLLNANPYQLSVVKERNPELAAVINDPEQKRKAQQTENELENLMMGDQLDPTVQARIAELIQQSRPKRFGDLRDTSHSRQRNIDAQMESALEHYPETFGSVTMLYVSCRVQGHAIKAFVDSGAQTTLMSESCARRCCLDRLIDKRWAGKAYGVGTQTIIGRVHNSLMEIGEIFIPYWNGSHEDEFYATGSLTPFIIMLVVGSLLIIMIVFKISCFWAIPNDHF